MISMEYRKTISSVLDEIISFQSSNELCPMQLKPIESLFRLVISKLFAAYRTSFKAQLVNFSCIVIPFYIGYH